MNRNQFWVLITGSCLVVLFLFLQVFLSRQAQYAQARLIAAQQVVTEGRNCDVRLRQLATRIYQVSTQTQDQALKDLLTRQQISVPAAATQPAAQPSAAPAAVPAH